MDLEWHDWTKIHALVTLVDFLATGLQFAAAATPMVRTSAHTSHTLTGLLRLYLRMGMSLSEHLEQSRRPQCRLEKYKKISVYDSWNFITSTFIPAFDLVGWEYPAVSDSSLFNRTSFFTFSCFNYFLRNWLLFRDGNFSPSYPDEWGCLTHSLVETDRQILWPRKIVSGKPNRTVVVP